MHLSPPQNVIPEANTGVPEKTAAESLLLCLRKALGHELPNQFVAVQGLVRVLEWEEFHRLSAAGQDYLRRLGAAAERAHGMIRTLADVLRGHGAGRASELVPFHDVALEAVSQASQLLPERAVEYSCAGAGVFLPVSRLALRQVLMQLIQNGVQATARTEVPRLELAARPLPGGNQFWVTDRGRGFPPEKRTALDDFLAGRVPALGAGFGLLFVRLIVESWAGQLHVETAPGRGTTVRVNLPA